MKRKDIYTLLFGVLCCAGTSLCFSCADDLEIGKQFDERLWREFMKIEFSLRRFI